MYKLKKVASVMLIKTQKSSLSQQATWTEICDFSPPDI